MDASHAVDIHISTAGLAGAQRAVSLRLSAEHRRRIVWVLVAWVVAMGAGITGKADDVADAWSVALRWDIKDTNAIGCVVVYGMDAGTEWLRQDAGTNSSLSIGGLQPATTYQFAVSAYN